MKIYLVGLSGVGKTTFGKKLSARLSLSFLDLDLEIEKQEGISISEIFKLKGENAFRKLEMEQLKLQQSKSNLVIATGGGTPCFFDNMNWMLNNGTVVYLQLPIEDLALRLSNSYKRPLLFSDNKEEIENQLRSQLEVREKQYKKAHLSLDVKDLGKAKMDEFVTLLKELN